MSDWESLMIEDNDNDGKLPRRDYTGARLHRSTQQYEFIAWDGEGVAFKEPIALGNNLYHWGDGNIFVGHEAQPQPYVLLGHSKGGRIVNPDGLTTIQILDYLLEVKQQYPRSIFIGFSINYDINQWFRNLNAELLHELYNKKKLRFNHVRGSKFSIAWLPGKKLYIKETRITSVPGVVKIRSCVIYDVFGFFQSSFLNACRKYLGTDDPDLNLIERGKDARSLFTIEEMDEFIIPYNNAELKMLVRMMDMVREDFHAVDIHPSGWYGPGAVAEKVLRKYNIESALDKKLRKEILDASQYAYAGGRFEQFGVGRYPGTVYEYDIRSAYPSAAATLPCLQGGTWEHVERFQPGAFGVYHIEYDGSFWGDGESSNRPQPLFCRSEDGRISFPDKTEGWFWAPEAALCASYVREGWVFRPATDDKPFAFIREMYDQRRALKVQGSSTERALKLILNSIYGKLAQLVGGRDGNPPMWHQLEYAGFITSYTRAKIMEAVMLNPDAIIAIETDAVFSKEPLDLPLSDNLGDWEKKVHKEIVYLQSGFYYATEEDGSVLCRFRGMDRDRKRNEPVGLPFGEVLDHLRNSTGRNNYPKIWARRVGDNKRPGTPSLRGSTTRFIGLGLGLNTESVWRSWETKPRTISLDQDPWFNKRHHIIEDCPECQADKTMYDCLHTMWIGGYSGHSYPCRIPWRTMENEVPLLNDYYAEYLQHSEWDAFS